MALKKKTIEIADNAKSKKLSTKESSQRSSFPIIGIGASAGGLEALELFLSHVPAESGMAYVIVQHLDPTRKDMLVELLQRCTDMQVLQAKDRMRIEPNHVYVTPPNKDISILHGMLYLLDPSAPRGFRLPIDFFFRALADEQQEKSIGVILSGMGSDGTLGLRAIKEKAGTVFVQEPASAKFDSMPNSVIEARLADVIDTADALPDRICAYLKHVPFVTKPGYVVQQAAQTALGKVLILLRSQTGHDFSLYKTATLYRRIERRMALHQIGKIAGYVNFLQENPQEVELLFQELLIGVTSFFRDPQAWEKLETEAFPALLAGRAGKQILRAWIPACSTGEEAYSLAILFKEALEKLEPAPKFSLQIFATDLDKYAIDKAREGIFLENIAADVSAKRLERFFVKVDRGYQVVKSIREMIIFAPQNIIMDPPFTRLDIICCRNLLIYLGPEVQKKLFPTFYYCLKPGGILFLGSAETIGNFTDLFKPLPGKSQLFRRQDSAPLTQAIEFPMNLMPASPATPAKLSKPKANLQTLAENLLLQTYSPAAALTNDKGDILYINGRTGKYLEPAAGKANWNIFVMARDGLRYELANAFQKALSQKETVVLESIVLDHDGGKQFVKVTIQPMSGSNALAGMFLIVFNDVGAVLQTKRSGKPSRGTDHVKALEQELEQTRYSLQSIRAEMQNSHEEIESANEELQSTNEEIQSSNEELTTSKEEMQSMNEELLTVNQELQTKLNELSRTNSDMKNLLDSTDIATLFLDNDLNVRRFNSQTSKITQLIPADVGRPISDIASALLYPELTNDAREVLRTLAKVERQLPIAGGDWFVARILPYRTLENMIDGVVITFTDITVSKKLEMDLRSTQERLREKLARKK
jgi:two-component system CheB/CheR fusion protein